MLRLLKMCTRLVVILVAGELAARGVARLTYHDPFAPYQAIMPGQSSNALAHYPCRGPVAEQTGTETAFCEFAPEGGSFDLVTVEYDHIIKRIGFSVRQDSLHLGDLTPCWDRPTGVEPDFFTPETGLLDVHWGKQLYVVFDTVWSRYGGRLNYALPIGFISIEGQGVACGSG